VNIPITNINYMNNVTLITLINIPTCGQIIPKIFISLSDNNINVDMISQTSPLKGYINLSFTISDDDLFAAIQALKDFKSTVPNLRIEVNSNNTKISLYGEGMKTTPGTAAMTLKILDDNDVDIIMITTSEVDISYLVYATDAEKAIKLFSDIIESN